MMQAFICKSGSYLWHSIVCLAVLAWIVTALWAFSYSLSIHRRRQAERLLHELQALEPGSKGATRAQHLAKEFHATEHCTGDTCFYDFETGFGYTPSGMTVMLKRTEWDSVGLRPWRVSARVELRNNETTHVEFDTLIGRGRGWLYSQNPIRGNEWGWLSIFIAVDADRSHQSADLEREVARQTGRTMDAGAPEIIIKKPHLNIDGGGEALSILVSPSASVSTKASSFDINLRCATSMLPCIELCQLAPSAWRAYSHTHFANGSWGQAADCLTY